MQDAELHEAFLEEMQELEDFALSYNGLYPDLPLKKEDPDVRRLLESLAFLSARTLLVSRRNLLKTRRRLFSQYFSYLLQPLPAMAILKATPTGRQAEVVSLPENTEVLLKAPDESTGIFRTEHALRVVPIELERLELLLRSDTGYRLMLHFRSRFPRNEDVGDLDLRVDNLGDYFASLTLWQRLLTHTSQVSVFYEQRPDEDSTGRPCTVSFGSLHQGRTFQHPIEAVRSFFHFPERDLMIRVGLPKASKAWSCFTLCFDLDREWPRALKVNPDVFQLFTVPLVNCEEQPANPILADGTRERFSLYHSDRLPGFVMHSVRGVFRLTESGAEPIRAGILSGEGGSWELETDGARRSWLLLNFPRAFMEPAKISVQARWYQPWFSENLSEQLKPSLARRHFPGVKWEIPGEGRPHMESPLEKDADGLLQLLALRMKPYLGVDDLRTILHMLGSASTGYFRFMAERLISLDREARPGSDGKGGVMQHYCLGLKEFEPSFLPVVDRFCEQVFTILDAWSFDAPVEMEVTGPTLEKNLEFPRKEVT